MDGSESEYNVRSKFLVTVFFMLWKKAQVYSLLGIGPKTSFKLLKNCVSLVLGEGTLLWSGGCLTTIFAQNFKLASLTYCLIRYGALVGKGSD